MLKNTVKKNVCVWQLLCILCVLQAQRGSTNRKTQAPPADPVWQSVLGGNAVSPPKRTSYGFVAVSEGGILSACTGSGTVIWRRRLSDKPSALYTVTPHDFIYLVSSNGAKLSLFNPDGFMLWQNVLEEKAVSAPLCGRDGRVFIAGKNSLSCYGTQGTKRWSIELPRGGDFALYEMNDGSLLYIPEKKKNGAHTGIRISPYGELLEDLEFTAQIASLASYDGGLIFGFKTGTVGCVAVSNAATETQWSIPAPQKGSVPELIIPGKTGFCVLYSGRSLCEYDYKTRSLLWSVQNAHLEAGKDFFSAYDNGAYLFARTSAAGTYTAAYSSFLQKTASAKDVKTSKEDELLDGGAAALWEKNIKTAPGSRYPLITHSLYLVVCGTDWKTAAYTIKDDDKDGHTVYDFQPARIQTYGAFTGTGRKLQPNVRDGIAHARYEPFSDIAARLSAGDYGIKEYGYKKRIENELISYAEEYFSPQNAASSAVKKNATLSLIERFETTDFNYAVPLFLKNEKEPVLLGAAMHCAARLGYDPDGKMLEAIEQVYRGKKTILPDGILIELAESVYALCRYMGRPAFIRRGKALLSDMLITPRSTAVKNKIHEIMFRFIELENPGTYE